MYDPSLNLYGTTETFVSSNNVCRELFQQLVKTKEHRFANMVANDDGLFPVPIEDGDTISFLCEIAPNANQRVIGTNETIPSKTYKIRIIIGDDSNNTNPVD